MSLLSALLPIAASAATNVASSATSYVVTGAIEKVKEGTSKIAETLGVNSAFEKIGAALPSVKDLTSQAILSKDSELASNDFLKQQVAEAKAADIPSASASNMKAAAGGSEGDTSHIIKLYDDTTKVLFKVMPQVTESISVQYDPVQPVQNPGSFQKFRGSDATQWTINATFISRTSDEADENMDNLNALRGWSKPYFGENTKAAYPNQLGAPPAVLTFEGLRERLIGPVPVVITSLVWNWPNDVDYIPTSKRSKGGLLIPFPAVITLAITVVESFSTAQINKFSLRDYRNGDMTAAYNSGGGMASGEE